MEEFINYLKLEKDCKGPATVAKYVKCLKTIYIKARKKGYTRIDPFDDIKITVDEGKIHYLQKKELDRIIRKDFQNDRLNRVADFFLFCCFTGLGYAEASSLTTEGLHQAENGSLVIKKTRRKMRFNNSSMSVIPIIEPAKKIWINTKLTLNVKRKIDFYRLSRTKI